jgi:hypothetical protein
MNVDSSQSGTGNDRLLREEGDYQLLTERPTHHGAATNVDSSQSGAGDNRLLQ